MNFMGRKLLRHGSRHLRMSDILRRTTGDKPCPGDKCQAPAPPTPTPTPPPTECYPPPPPCPTKPVCPPAMCPKNPDPNNPCNYCPPPCIDPDYPDLTRLKKLQCRFQEDNDISVHLKGNKTDVILYHTAIIMVTVGTMYAFYALYKLISP